MIRKLLIRGRKEYGGHLHSFEGVIQALPDDPSGFTIAGFEDLYSKQEQESHLLDSWFMKVVFTFKDGKEVTIKE